MTDHRAPQAVHDKDRMRNVLLSFVLAALAAWLLWKFGEPMSIQKFGTGAPGWLYPLFFIRPVFLWVQLREPPARAKPAHDREFSRPVFHDDPLLP